ncbi:MAG: hypothetical protein D6820_01245 [Lentisphaerae bacterium]|nr:MAG: hypothetical protein D6820_01245 [Lentisphaerota bacterium]
MPITIIPCPNYDRYFPFCVDEPLEAFHVCNQPLRVLQQREWNRLHNQLKERFQSRGLHLSLREEAFVSTDDLTRMLSHEKETVILEDKKYGRLAWLAPGSQPEDDDAAILRPHSSLLILNPWHLLDLNELLLNRLDRNEILGEVKPGAVIDGRVRMDGGSVLLPGTYIEGHVVIGKNCKIGPNCYLRGPISIGDNVHIGNAVEVKASIIGHDSSVGHLSYVGDSIIGNYVNFGAGTITANFRHDGRHHRMMVMGELMDTGRRKLGAFVGHHVHTGIHTSIYPGRILGPGTSTLPGTIVRKNITDSSRDGAQN